MRAKKLNGFSLMEMMVVLLIVAIIAAASAPMVTKKLSRNVGTGDSPWVFTGLNNNIAYLGGGDGQVLIGTAQVPDDADNASMYIAGRNGWSHLRFGNEDGTRSIGITADPGNDNGINGRIGISNLVPEDNSILLGTSQTVENNSTDVIAIGTRAIVSRNRGIAIGGSAEPDNDNVDIEANFGDQVPTWAAGGCSVAIGQGCVAGEVNHRATSNNTFNSWATAIGVDAYAPGESSVAIGVQPTAIGNWSTALGAGAKTLAESAVSVGSQAYVNTTKSIAIGDNAHVEVRDAQNQLDTASIAIGPNSTAYTRGGSLGGIAIGPAAFAGSWQGGGIAIGARASATGFASVAIGYNAQTSTEYEIKLGDDARHHTVYIPGNLIVGGNVILNRDVTEATTSIRTKRGSWRHPVSVVRVLETRYPEGGIGLKTYGDGVYVSDRRLKNVGDKYAAGLAELKKLDFFHYTFKKDEEKTPHVGVIAQDLQKVFPDAVTKGEDGYLRIRWEDMFYAVINAVKELDNKITEIVQNITDINSTIEKQNQTIEEQAKIIEEQNTRLAELEELKGKQTKILESQAKDIDNLIKRIEQLEAK